MSYFRRLLTGVCCPPKSSITIVGTSFFGSYLHYYRPQIYSVRCTQPALSPIPLCQRVRRQPRHANIPTGMAGPFILEIIVRPFWIGKSAFALAWLDLCRTHELLR